MPVLFGEEALDGSLPIGTNSRGKEMGAGYVESQVETVARS